ncbi:MAG: LytR/AlgR family response regulator transcription factor [Saprospiraceae bacterium]
MKYLIIDDEYIAHDIIQEYCDMLPNLELVKNCYDALEALTYLRTNKVDLIFLDLNMPKIKGFEFLRTLSNPPSVIVTTAYQEYALEGYELNIVDYLLKPFSFSRFLTAINKVVGTKTKTANITNTIGNTATQNTIFLRSNKRYIQVLIDEILYIEAAGNYAKVVTLNEVITIREKISDVLVSLDKAAFLQVHKSFAVAIKHIHSIEGNRITIGEHLVPIGKLYKLKVNELIR